MSFAEEGTEGEESVDVAKGMRNLVQPKEELMKIRQ